MYYSAPTYYIDTKTWSTTDFETRLDYRKYIDAQVKYPSEYNLKFTNGYWNEQGLIFSNTGSYPKYTKNSLDFKNHWTFEKEKCKFDGCVIYISEKNNTNFALPGLAYFYLNYCPIYDKLKRGLFLPEIYDGDYHYFLYLLRCILHGKFGCVLKKRQCLLGSTVIYTPNGFRRIDDLEKENYTGPVYSFNQQTKEIIEDSITKVWKAKRVSSHLKITTNEGKYIECSKDHKIFTNRGWVRADEIIKQDILTIYKSPFGELNISEEEAKLIGYFLADGSLSSKKSAPKFTNITPAYLDEFEKLISVFDSDVVINKVRKGNGFDYVIVNKEHSHGKINTFKQWLIKEGFCKKRRFRNLPEKYLKLNREKTSLLLNRLFAADGWISEIKSKSKRYEIGIASESIELLQQIQDLLFKYNITSNINTEYATFFKLRILNSKSVNIFLKEIGIYGKSENLEYSTLLHLKKDVVLGKVKKIKEVFGDAQLYDISTLNNESFFANGIYVHNSGYTLKNMGVLLLAGWFGDSAISKMFAFDEAAVADSWGLMENYKQHINKHCGWKRGFSPDKLLDWKIMRKRNDGSTAGNLSVFKGFTTKLDPSRGVGGNMTVLFGEEAGKNPTLDKTHNFVTSNVSLGGAVTGLIIYSGAVGELTKCEPLKKFILNPRENNFLTCPNEIEEDKDFGLEVGFFAPEWWNFVDRDENTGDFIKFYDEWGNTDKEGALKRINELREFAKQASPEDYRYYCSQRPLSIRESFDYRKESIFPQGLLSRQEYRIDRGDYPFELFDIERGGDGKPKFLKNKHPEITEFPFRPKKDVIPYGCIKVFERPIPNAPWGTYLAGVDAVAVDITSTSESLFSVIIFKNLVEVKYTEDGEEKVRLEGDEIVAKFIGRKEEVKKNNELAMLLIEMYNAFTVAENNVSNFITFMIEKSKQKYLAMKSDLPFLKELETNQSSHQEYGVRTNPTMWSHYINKSLEYIKEEIGVEHMNDGSVLRKKYGVEKLKDKRLVKEYMAFTDLKGNYDEIISFSLVLCLAKSRQTNGLIVKVDQRQKEETDKNLYKPQRKLFKNLNTDIMPGIKLPRTAFKNLK